MTRIILFDGTCNFCNNSVQFVFNRDPNGYFKFAPLQSETGRKLLNNHGLDKDINSFILIENEKCYIKSSAVLQVCRHLKGLWRFLTIFQIIPVPIRDFVYDIVAKNRYKLFGKKESCMIPSPEIRHRFLD